MPKASPLHNRFNRGELSPRIYGRTDLEYYFHGLRTMCNFYPLGQGPAVRRSGLRFIAEASDNDRVSRLVPFEFSTLQAYVLEFAHQKIRVFKDGGIVLDGSDPLEIASPYAESELAGLKFAQSADVLYICHPNHAVRSLTRTSHVDWTLAQVEFADGPYLDENLTATTLQPSAISGTSVTVTASAVTGINGGSGFLASDVGRSLRLEHGSTWGWGRITAVASTTSVTVAVEADFGGTGAVDEWRLGAWSGTSGYPRAIAFYDGRLWFAGSSQQPQTLWGSVSGDFETFRPTETDGDVLDDNGCTFTVSADQVNAILWMQAAGGALIMGTTGGEWRLSTGNGDPVSPANPVAPRRETAYGCADVQGLVAGPAVLFVQRQGRKVREMAYALESDSWQAPDLTLLSDHLTLPGAVVFTAWMAEPEPGLLCVRADGAIIALSCVRSQNVQGWTRIETDGVIESLAVIPGAGRSEPWVTVKRSIQRTGFDILVADLNGDGLTDGRAGDGFTVPDGVTWQAGCMVRGVNGSGEERCYLYKGAQAIAASGADQAVTFATAPSGSQVESIRNPAGVLDATHWEELTDASVTRRYVERLEPWFDGHDQADAFFVDSGLSHDGAPVSSVSGLTHLTGCEVQILADGAVLPPQVVGSAGTLSLDAPASVVHAGLGFVSTLCTMPAEAGAADGTALGRTKRIHRLKLRLHESLGVTGLRFGPDEQTLDVLDFRQEQDPLEEVPPLFSGVIDAGKMPGGLNREGSIVIEQRDPLPCTLVALMPQLYTEDR